MAVKIGHASCDEFSRAAGGQAGDQTGKEVCIRDWYAGKWNVVLRPKSAEIANRMARFCEDICNNPKIGYDQYQRNTLRAAAQMAGWDGTKITVACETDCSAFMTVCAEAAGVKVAYAYGNAPTTWTMRNAFVGTGAFEALTDSKYVNSDRYLRRGDILVRESGHTAMVLSNGSEAAPYSAAATDSAQKTQISNGGKVHIVEAGDTLWDISRKYGTSVAELCIKNGIDSSAFIRVGQRIEIP